MNNGYWSIYRKDGLITSPFYHNLHIAQLMVLYKYTGKSLFLNYSRKFIKYRRSPFKRIKAFVNKAKQKIREED